MKIKKRLDVLLTERMYADSALTPATLFTESYTYIKGNWNVKSES